MSNLEEYKSDVADVEKLYDWENSTAIYEFKIMIRCNSLDEVIIHSLILLEHLELKIFEKS